MCFNYLALRGCTSHKFEVKGCLMESNNRRKATQTKKILIRCSPEQHEKIFNNASLNKMNASQYILKCALKEDFKNESDHELISTLIQMKADLARLGNLFKLCIDQHDINSEQFKDTVNNIKKISSNISLFLEKKLK